MTIASDADVGADLRQLRRNIDLLLRINGLTRQDLAPVIGVSKTAVYDRFKARPGHDEPVEFSASELLAVARYFGVTLDDLFQAWDLRGIRPTQAKHGLLMGRHGGLPLRRDPLAA